MSKQVKASNSQLATHAYEAAIYIAQSATENEPNDKKLHALCCAAFDTGCAAVQAAAEKALAEGYARNGGDPNIFTAFRASSFGSVFDLAFVRHLMTSQVVRKNLPQFRKQIDWDGTSPLVSLRALNELRARQAFRAPRKRA